MACPRPSTRALASHADGVVVGSAIAARVEEEGPPAQVAARVREFVEPLKAPLRGSGAR